jgi:hypothetical protein
MLRPLALPRHTNDPVLKAVRRHPFFLGALLLHGAALWLVSQLHSQGLVEANLRSNRAQIQAHTQAAEQHGMRRRVDSLKAMKTLMERIDRAQAEPDDSLVDSLDAAPSPAPGASQPPAAAQTPQEMLAQARELRDSIQRIEQAAQARKMAELLKLAPEQALEKVKQQAAAAALREANASAPQTHDQVAQALERYEQQARASLQRLQAQRAQERDGTATHSDTAAGPASHPGGAAGPGGPAGDAKGGAAGGPRGGAAGGTTGPADGRRSSVNDAQPRRYDGQQHALAINAGQLRLGAGNALGPGGVLANRVYVDRWYLIGPFHAANASSMDKVFPPEQWVDLDGVYLGKGQRVLRWQYVSSAAYPLIPPDYAEQAIYYGHTEITSDRARDVWMALGADDDAKLWVNDQLVWTSGNQRKPWYTNGGVQSLKKDIQALNLIEERRRVHLRKGRNTLLFKLYNSPLDVFFSLVIEPVEGGG